MQRDLLLNAIVRIQKSCPDKSKCQDKHHITAVFFSSASNWRKSFFLVKMHFRYAMPDVLIFLKLLRFALLEQFLDDACSIALPRYIMLTILSENWLLHFQKLESTFPMSKFCWWKRLNMQNFISFCWLHMMTSWIFWALKNMLNTVKGLWLRENGRKKW